MRGARRRRGSGVLSMLVSVAAAALAGFVTSRATVVGSGAGVATLPVEVTEIPLDQTDPARQSVGPLRYLGGLWLRAADSRFGGFSDVRVSADGERINAVSDCGAGFTARLAYDGEGRLVGLGDARLVMLTSPSGALLNADEVDAESLVALEDGGFEVGFEGRARVQVYRPGFASPGPLLAVPAAVSGCGYNAGLELMADAGGGRRLLVCEARRAASTSVPAWIGASEAWREREYPLTFDGGWAGEPFRPTGAARLPGGDLLVVERRFPPLAARLVRVPRASLEGAGPLEPHELARLEPPLTLDNIEGVDVRRDARGRTLVYLLSDDNNCSKRLGTVRPSVQRTLLLLFALVD